MPRWRGFDNPFGDIYTILDGINIFKNHLEVPQKKFIVVLKIIFIRILKMI